MVNGIQKTGGAEIGDKTLLDALIPAVESLKRSALRNEDIISSMRKFVEEAVNGAESTKGIVARKGRASYVGERSLGFPDPGAMAVAIIHKEILNRIFLR
jgi:dihydroxyacetone kinase